MTPFALYIHIPYCSHKCPYCDFNTYVLNKIPEVEYVAALQAEFDKRCSEPAWQGRRLSSIYFGGGTPSLFEAGSIGRLLNHFAATCGFSEDIEITLEANPGRLSEERLRDFYVAGVNRLSLGAQSLQRATLKALGRLHTPRQVVKAVSMARAAGIENLNLDLIYGVPGQTLQQLKADMNAVMALDPCHISAYGLTIEKGTPFYERYRLGVLELPPEELLAAMFEELVGFLPSCGYPRYEISNFAKRGREARHNLAYWNGDDYLGLGAGAHSFFGRDTDTCRGIRWSNYALPKRYMQAAMESGNAESWREELTPEAAMFEFFFLGLRKTQGVSLLEFARKFRISARRVYPAVIDVLLEGKLLEIKGEYLALTQRGLLLADSVIENFSEPVITKRKRPAPHEALDDAAFEQEPASA